MGRQATFVQSTDAVHTMDLIELRVTLCQAAPSASVGDAEQLLVGVGLLAFLPLAEDAVDGGCWVLFFFRRVSTLRTCSRLRSDL